MISVVFVAHNEADKLKKSLKNVAHWADEIVIIDLESTDTTRNLAQTFSAQYILHPFVPYVELVRNFAIDQCHGNWILVLDPDELLPNSLKKVLSRYAQTHTQGVLNIPRKNIFFEKWIQHTNFWPDYQIRFFSKGTVQWQERIHSYPRTTLPVTRLPLKEQFALRHYGYSNFADFIERQNRYSSVRAREQFDAGETFSFWRLCRLVIREFVQRYIWHRGYRDRKQGLFLVLGLMTYHALVEWKLWELENQR